MRDSSMSVRGSPNGASPPTRETIEGWKREGARLHEEINALKSRRDWYMAMIAAAEHLLPQPELKQDEPESVSALNSTRIPAAEPKRRGRPPKIGSGDKTWTATIDRILRAQNHGISYEKLKEEVSKTHLGKKLAQTEKSFHGAIGKLAAHTLLVRHNGWLFAPPVYARFRKDVAAGRAVDEKAPRGGHPSPFGDAIKAFLDERPSGAGSAEIIQELRGTPEFSDTMERHRSHLYNVLSRLVDQGELVKGGGKYFRAPNKQGGAPHDAAQSPMD
jgi:hypothetical protein